MEVQVNSPGPFRPKHARLDRAYGCFAFLGLVMLVFAVFDVLDKFGLLDPKTLDDWGELFEITLAIPLFVAMVIVTVYGIVRTVQLRHPGLVVLSTVSIVCGAGYMGLSLTGWDGGGRILGDVAAVAFGTYAAANVLIPGWWFLKGRRVWQEGPGESSQASGE